MGNRRLLRYVLFAMILFAYLRESSLSEDRCYVCHMAWSDVRFISIAKYDKSLRCKTTGGPLTCRCAGCSRHVVAGTSPRRRGAKVARADFAGAGRRKKGLDALERAVRQTIPPGHVVQRVDELLRIVHDLLHGFPRGAVHFTVGRHTLSGEKLSREPFMD